jgi:Uma2 family endonuclease
MALAAQPLMTVEQFLVASARDPHPAQLIDGVMVVNSPRWLHQRACGLIYARMLAWCESAEGFGEPGLNMDLVLDRYNCFVPDVWWVPDSTDLREVGVHRIPPDLVVEVRSPSTWHYDRGVKRRRYAGWGVDELWLVDTERDEVVACRRSASGLDAYDVELVVPAGEPLTTPLLPGFTLATAELFADIPEGP